MREKNVQKCRNIECQSSSGSLLVSEDMPCGEMLQKSDARIKGTYHEAWWHHVDTAYKQQVEIWNWCAKQKSAEYKL